MNTEEYPLASEVVKKHVYMDDKIVSFKDEKTAIQARSESNGMVEKAGMDMKKWKSSSQEVMETIPVSGRAAVLFHPIEDKRSATTKSHGVLCSTDEDSLSLVFDSLCLFAPFTHRAKMLFQLTWSEGTDWDDFLPDDQQKKWTEWFGELAELCSISVPRCLHPFLFGLYPSRARTRSPRLHRRF